MILPIVLLALLIVSTPARADWTEVHITVVNETDRKINAEVWEYDDYYDASQVRRVDLKPGQRFTFRYTPTAWFGWVARYKYTVYATALEGDPLEFNSVEFLHMNQWSLGPFVDYWKKNTPDNHTYTAEMEVYHGIFERGKSKATVSILR